MCFFFWIHDLAIYSNLGYNKIDIFPRRSLIKRARLKMKLKRFTF